MYIYIDMYYRRDNLTYLFHICPTYQNMTIYNRNQSLYFTTPLVQTYLYLFITFSIYNSYQSNIFFSS